MEINSTQSTESLADFILMARGFWYKRNKMIYENINLPPRQVLSYILSLKGILPIGLQQQATVKNLNYRWSPPPPDWFKLNVDGTLFFDYNKTGIRAILYNACGDVIMALSKVEDEFLELENVKAMVVLRGLQFCLQIGIHNLLIESDCFHLVEEINSDAEACSTMRTMIAKIRRLMLRFMQCKIQHGFHMANAAAHYLARHAWSIF
ncbi:uncharacterized protein LOC118347968 [Juglans regia]|uniref:Uncharacterized protein LOC118347968 n=1 Tax=Juglans regia TaxID=51240 RepID=A0A6P9EPS7_JUGRE|nr:uncharacterized protein LOC118347968 [Juglans regia]